MEDLQGDVMNANTAQVEALFGAAIKFVPDLSNDLYSIYTVSADQNRYLFDVVVNNLTQEIKVCFADMTEVEIDSKVRMKTIITLEGATSRPSSDSVKSIIYPRIIGLLADKMTA